MQLLIVVFAGLLLMVPIWWPTGSESPSEMLWRSVMLAPQRSVPVGSVVAVVALLVGLLAGLLLYGPIIGLATLVLTGICVVAIAVQFRSRRSLQEAEQLAQLTNSLANQALVAPTVVQAIQHSAHLVEGRVGIAVKQLAAECETGGLVEASNRFASTIQRPIAEMLATVLIEAFRGGAQWVGLASVLAEEAAQLADTARYFHRHVAVMMPQIAVTVVLAIAMIAITGFAAKDVGEWLGSPVGQQMLLVLALLSSAICGRILAPAWKTSQ
ncbi:MAG: hypothetical protein F4X48_07815 [Acidimicrobiia bacterium]|nr:hypothetical protein [Acidimicrobiia bacterium]MYC58463.1 hypothetical protein [Acidimicrobiia bacterium]